jgi:hypothetical protein
MWRQAAGDIFLIMASAFALPLASYFATNWDRMAEIVIDDGICDEPGALVADLDLNVGSAGEFFLAAYLSDGGAELVVGLDPVLRAAVTMDFATACTSS